MCDLNRRRLPRGPVSADEAIVVLATLVGCSDAAITVRASLRCPLRPGTNLGLLLFALVSASAGAKADDKRAGKDEGADRAHLQDANGRALESSSAAKFGEDSRWCRS